MDRRTIDSRLSFALATLCMAVTSKERGALSEAKQNILDVVEDLTKEAVTDSKFVQTFGSDNPILRPAR